MRKWVVVLGFLVVVAPATAQTAAPPRLYLEPDGNPQLIGSPWPNGAVGSVSWAICRPDAACAEVPGADSVFLRPGDVPAGTAFEVRVDHEGTRTTARSEPWLGRVTSTERPAVTGRPKVGGRVSLAPEAWTGGWGGDYDELFLEACRDPDDLGTCEVIGHGFSADPPTATLAPRDAGKYLVGFAVRRTADTAYPAIAYQDVRDRPVVERVDRAVVASTPAGPVAGKPQVLPWRRYGRVTRRSRKVEILLTKGCPVRIDVERRRRVIVITVRGVLDVPAGAGCSAERVVRLRGRLGRRAIRDGATGKVRYPRPPRATG